MRVKATPRTRRGLSPSELNGYRASGTANAFRSGVQLNPRQVLDFRNPTPPQRVLQYSEAREGARRYGNERLLREVGNFIGSLFNAKPAPKNLMRRR